MMWIARLSVCLLLLASLVGCGRSSGRVAFSGRVTHAGQPVSGTILLTPTNKGPVATTSITEGSYLFTAVTGPLPGVHEITIETTVKGQKGASAAPIQPLIWKLTRSIDAEVLFETDFALETPASAPPAP